VRLQYKGKWEEMQALGIGFFYSVSFLIDYLSSKPEGESEGQSNCTSAYRGDIAEVFHLASSYKEVKVKAV